MRERLENFSFRDFGNFLDKYRRVIIAIVAALGLLLTGHGNAIADTNTDQFLVDMAAAGFGNGDGNQQLIKGGWQVCRDLANGTSEATEAHTIWTNSELTSQALAQKFVDISVQDLCPGEA